MAKKSRKTQIIEALEQTPNVSSVCQKVGISRQTYYRWLEEDVNFANKVEKAVKMGDEYFCDMVENQMMRKVSDGYWPAIKYGLERRHKKYMKKSEIPTTDPADPELIELEQEQDEAFALLYSNKKVKGTHRKDVGN